LQTTPVAPRTTVPLWLMCFNNQLSLRPLRFSVCQQAISNLPSHTKTNKTRYTYIINLITLPDERAEKISLGTGYDSTSIL